MDKLSGFDNRIVIIYKDLLVLRRYTLLYLEIKVSYLQLSNGLEKNYVCVCICMKERECKYSKNVNNW